MNTLTHAKAAVGAGHSTLGSMVRSLVIVALSLCACGFELGGVLGSSIDETRDTDALDEASGGPAWTGGDATSDDAPDPSGDSSGAAEPDPATTGGGEPLPPRGVGDCCSAHASTGCNDPAIQQCVCTADPGCCTDGWDPLCAQEVEQLGCGSCDREPDAPLGCCGDTDSPGCGDPAIEACVCDADAYCCVVEWDESCAAKAVELGCTSCDAGANTATDCCTPHPTAGCDDVEVAECVCANGDKFCCETAWDELCVDEVADYGCGACGGMGDDGTGGVGPLAPVDCCAPSELPSCPDAEITECVCGYDDYCCQVAWDGVCVDQIDQAGCGSCLGQAGSESGGGSDSSGSGG